MFHVLREYSTDLWRTQLFLILEKNGFASFVTHPDYLRSEPAREIYKQLLTMLSLLGSEGVLWMALPGEIQQWWRQRSQMSLVQIGGAWTVVGEGSERARVAFATLDRDRLCYEVDGTSTGYTSELPGCFSASHPKKTCQLFKPGVRPALVKTIVPLAQPVRKQQLTRLRAVNPLRAVLPGHSLHSSLKASRQIRMRVVLWIVWRKEARVCAPPLGH